MKIILIIVSTIICFVLIKTYKKLKKKEFTSCFDAAESAFQEIVDCIFEKKENTIKEEKSESSEDDSLKKKENIILGDGTEIKWTENNKEK